MISNEYEPNPTRFRWLLGGMSVLAVAVLIVWWPGCREYPPVTSRESLTILRLLNSACNTRDTQRVAQAEKRLEELKRKGLISSAEQEGFDKILSLARAGQWEDAEKAAFKMAEDQVGVGHPDPNQHDHKPAPKNARRP